MFELVFGGRDNQESQAGRIKGTYNMAKPRGRDYKVRALRATLRVTGNQRCNDRMPQLSEELGKEAELPASRRHQCTWLLRKTQCIRGSRRIRDGARQEEDNKPLLVQG